jgi:hypothetical protein
MANDLTVDRDTLKYSVERPVKVTLPASAAFDLDVFVKVQRSIFDRLGHAMCVSGFDIRWRFEDDFLVNDKLDIIAR